MGKETKIEWTDHTFNPWVGCSKISPACDHCYAESWAKRAGHPELWAGEHRRTTAANWRQPEKWDREAFKAWHRPRVFCASLADVFDNQVPDEWRRDLWALIERTPRLDWLLLTKRPQYIRKMLPWGHKPWENVWLGTTVENQEEANRRIPLLLGTPAVVRFVSCEPMLGPVSLQHGTINWVIVGGESGPGARPCDVRWMRSVIGQCKTARVPVFVKQLGRFVIDRNDAGFDGCEVGSWPLRGDGSEREIDNYPFGYEDHAQGAPCRVLLDDRKGGDPTEWPADLRVREFPQ